MIDIVVATPAQLKIVQQLAHKIWPIAYGNIITAEQINYMLQLIYSDDALLQQLQKGDQFLIAYQNDIAVGYASFSVKNTDTPQIFRLHKLYVDTTLHTKGIGKALLMDVMAACKKRSATSLELNVNKYNPAKTFYEKMGFTVTRTEVINIGNNFVMDDFVMTKLLIH